MIFSLTTQALATTVPHPTANTVQNGASSKTRGLCFVSALGEMFSFLPLPPISHLQDCDTFAQLAAIESLPLKASLFRVHPLWIKNPVPIFEHLNPSFLNPSFSCSGNLYRAGAATTPQPRAASGRERAFHPHPRHSQKCRSSWAADVGDSALKVLVGLKNARLHQYSVVELTRKPRRLGLTAGWGKLGPVRFPSLFGFKGGCKCGLLSESLSFK